MASLTVSEIRQAIWRAAGKDPAAGPGAEAGRLFHEVVAEALSSDSPAAWFQYFDPERLRAPDAAVQYARALYEEVLGPALAGREPAFHAQPEALLQLWNGVQQFSTWLVGALRECEARGVIRWQGREGWQGAGGLARAEVPVRWVAHRPHWRAPVEVSGTLDALWRNDASGRWCVVEWKLASGSPEADLAQLCLYHLMLEHIGEPGAAALVSFSPKPVQVVLEAAQLETVKEKLLDLIGELAGVAGAGAPAVPPASPSRPRLSFAPSREDEDLARRVAEVLQARGHGVSLGQHLAAGPAFLRVPVRLEPRASVRRVLSEADNLQVQLGLPARPFLRKGEGCILVEVPRRRRETVEFGSLALECPPEMKAPLLVGVDLAGAPIFIDLAAQTPHLLVAGATGSGKSEWLRTALASLIAAHTPAELRVVLIDPKRTAFGELRGSPYLWPRLGLLTPPDQDMVEAFDALIEEMEARYRELERQGAASLSEWRGEPETKPPRIVVFCDEYADLIHSAAERKELEKRVARLGAKGRAAGIHLILATQRASRDVVTGVIKSNLTGRVCLRVAEALESRLVLGVRGAEDLLGHGDLLWSDGRDPVRLQAPLLEEASRRRLFGATLAAGGG